MNNTFPIQDDSTGGILQEIFEQLPAVVRDGILFSWAREFQKTPTHRQDVILLELFSTITSLKFERNEADSLCELELLKYLPLFNLQEFTAMSIPQFRLPVENGPQDSILVLLSECPIFSNLTSLTLGGFAGTLSPLFDQHPNRNTFSKVKRLEVKDSLYASIDLSLLLTSPNHFPSLKVLIIGAKAIFDKSQIQAIFELNEMHFLGVFAPILPVLQSSVCSQLTKLSLSFCPREALDYLILEGSSRYLYSLRNNLFNNQTLIELFSSPIVTNLNTFELLMTDNDDAPSVVHAFRDSPYLSNLRDLTLDRILPRPGDQSMIVPLLSNPTFKLKTLTISTCILLPAELDIIASAPCLSDLKELYYGKQYFSTSGNEPSLLELLHSSSKIFSKLTKFVLNFKYSSLDPDLIASFLSSPNLSNDIIHLDLGHVSFDEQHFSVLGNQLANPTDPSSGLKFGKLQSLKVDGCTYSVQGIKSITHLSALTHLSFGYGSSTFLDEHLHTLLSHNPEFSTSANPVPLLPNLVSMMLDRSLLTDVGLSVLAQSPLLEQFRALRFRCAPVSTRDVVLSVVASPTACNLTHLILAVPKTHLISYKSLVSAPNHKYCSTAVTDQ